MKYISVIFLYGISGFRENTFPHSLPASFVSHHTFLPYSALLVANIKNHILVVPKLENTFNMECGLNFKKFKLFLIRSLILSFHQKIEKDA
jgi:hypothetical protein